MILREGFYKILINDLPNGDNYNRQSLSTTAATTAQLQHQGNYFDLLHLKGESCNRNQISIVQLLV